MYTSITTSSYSDKRHNVNKIKEVKQNAKNKSR